LEAENKMNNKKYDVVIVGGGVIGSSIAYHIIKNDPNIKLAVIEKDPTYTYASTTLCLGNLRIQFNLKENVQISQYGYKVMKRFEEDMSINGEKPSIYRREEGNLFLVSEKERESAQTNMMMQKDIGCKVEWLSSEEITTRWPLYKTKGFVGGTFGLHDGRMDAYAVLMAYKAKAKFIGAEYITGEAVQIKTNNKEVAGVGLASGGELKSKVIVNCAGAWATKLASTAGVLIPVDPVKRQVFVVDTKVKPDKFLPVTILPSGLYLMSETGDKIITSMTMADDPVGFSFRVDDHRFNEIVWPELAEFVPVFETLKLKRSWAGLYAVNRLDANAILGEWPELKGFFLANGFSGHGFQQAPAVGRYISELITEKAPELDLGIFSPERILENKPIVTGAMRYH
jgi:FAD-dependent oxidoreductase domain-containing protein 1